MIINEYYICTGYSVIASFCVHTNRVIGAQKLADYRRHEAVPKKRGIIMGRSGIQEVSNVKLFLCDGEERPREPAHTIKTK